MDRPEPYLNVGKPGEQRETITLAHSPAVSASSGVAWIGEHSNRDAKSGAPERCSNISLTAVRGTAVEDSWRLGADRAQLRRPLPSSLLGCGSLTAAPGTGAGRRAGGRRGHRCGPRPGRRRGRGPGPGGRPRHRHRCRTRRASARPGEQRRHHLARPRRRRAHPGHVPRRPRGQRHRPAARHPAPRPAHAAGSSRARHHVRTSRRRTGRRRPSHGRRHPWRRCQGRVFHSDRGSEPGFKRSLQHCLSMSIGAR